MTRDERIATLKAHLADPIEPVWAEPFHEAWLAAEGDPEPLRFARAQSAELAAAVPVIKPGELIVGCNALRPVVSGFHTAFFYGIRLDEERLARLRSQHPAARDRLDAIEAYWRGWFRETEYAAPFCMHASLAYERFLELGVAGVRRYVQHWAEVNASARPESGPWYEALLVTLDGIAAFIRAHARAAAEAADREADPPRRAELRSLARACDHIATDPPASFHEAVQLAYLLFWLCGHDSPGPVDRYLYPPLQRDLQRGAITLGQAQELVDCLFLKLEEKTAYGATIGGRLADGTDACNELTSLCLDATERLRILSPRTAFRWHAGVDARTFARACEVIASGASHPALVNDEAMIASLVDRGVAPEHAADYTFVGCGQTYPHGRGHGSYEDVVINAAKPLEWALNDGWDPVRGEQAGLRTGAAEALSTWEEFAGAFHDQMDHHVSACIGWVNEYRARHRDRWVCPLRSLVTHSCVERGRDWHGGGADYSEGMVDLVGFTTVTDSLVAIRRAVYEEGLLSLAELRDVLNADWDGRDDLRLYLLQRLPKFGNDDPEADGMMLAELDRANRLVRGHRTVFGGPWGVDIIGWSGAMEFGRVTGATPDGRRRGSCLADCAGPAQGRNSQGLTATLRSMFKLPHAEIHGPLALSLRLPSRLVRTPEGLRKLQQACETYFRGGGQQLQISIAGTDELQAAQRDPQAYADLMVRVGGFSAYFVRLEPEYQEDVIARSEMAV